uniref:Uncharacterized protein n=1 Tax=Strongyloides venezuelensis TaxID=75913 RepID=A0A0K0FFH0_STRVS
MLSVYSFPMNTYGQIWSHRDGFEIQQDAKYICNIVPIEKKNGDSRITFELRKLNDIMIPFHNSSPKLCHYLIHYSGYNFISKQNLFSTYSQTMYHPNDQNIFGGHFNNNIFSIPR